MHSTLIHLFYILVMWCFNLVCRQRTPILIIIIIRITVASSIEFKLALDKERTCWKSEYLQQYVGIEVNALLLFHFNLCWRAYEIYIPHSKQILNMDVFYFQMSLWYSWKLTDREKNVQCVSGQNGSLLWIMSRWCNGTFLLLWTK